MSEPRVDSQYPESSQATTALVLGILGVVGCWILAPIAWWIGRKELRAIDEGRRTPDNRSSARAGQILGIVGTALLVLLVPVAIVGIVLAQVERDEEGQITEEGTLSVFDLEVGDCGDLPDLEVYQSVTVLPCDQGHEFEVYAISTFTDAQGSDYPGDEAAAGWADQECYADFATYVGVSWEESPDLTYTYLYPTEESWAEDDREILCMLTHVDEGTALVGSKQGSGDPSA